MQYIHKLFKIMVVLIAISIGIGACGGNSGVHPVGHSPETNPFVPPGTSDNPVTDTGSSTITISFKNNDAEIVKSISIPSVGTKAINPGMGAVTHLHTDMLAGQAGNYDPYTASDFQNYTAEILGGGVDFTVPLGGWRWLTCRVDNVWCDVRNIEFTIGGQTFSPTTACVSVANPNPTPYTEDNYRVPLIAFSPVRDVVDGPSIVFSSVCDTPLVDFTLRINGNSEDTAFSTGNDVFDESDYTSAPGPWGPLYPGQGLFIEPLMAWDNTTTSLVRYTLFPNGSGEASISFAGWPAQTDVMNPIPFVIAVRRIDPSPFSPFERTVTGGVYIDITSGTNCTEEMLEQEDLDDTPGVIYEAYKARFEDTSAGATDCLIQTENRGAVVNIQ